MLWGANGVDICGGMAYGLTACINIVQVEDGSYVCAWMVEQGSITYIQLQKISKTGTLLWGDAVKIYESSASNDYPYLVNAGDNQVIVAYSRVTGSFTNKNLKARKIASDGSNVWANDLSIYSGYFGYTPLWVNMRVIADKMGGAFVGWYVTRDNPNREDTYVAHVKSNGTLGFNGAEGGVKVGRNTTLRSFFPEMYVDAEEGFLYVTWRETSNDMSQSLQKMVAQKLEISTGDLKWNQNGIDVVPYVNQSISFYSIQDGGENKVAIFFTWTTGMYGTDKNSALLINSEGEYVWEDEIILFSSILSAKDNMVSTPLIYNSFWLTAWGDERVVSGDPEGKRKIYMQKINIDGTLGGDSDVCLPPTNVNVESVTATSAVVSWSGEADDYEVEYRVVDGNWVSVEVFGAHSLTLENLTPNTDYQIHVRSICADEQVSVWSEIATFTTPDTPSPPCETPVNLNVTEITPSSATLSWKEGSDQNLNWDVRYREASSSSWNDVEALEEKTYLLEGLIPWTIYVWTVRAHCSEGRTSEWAPQNEFTTDDVGINNVTKKPITVYASGKMLNIINPENRYIEKIQLFSINGKLLGDYTVKSADNVLIPTTINEMMVIVKIIGEGKEENHKILMR
jgi:hypothetical protein